MLLEYGTEGEVGWCLPAAEQGEPLGGKQAWQRLPAAVSCTSRSQCCQEVGCSHVDVFIFLRLMGQILWATPVLPLVQDWEWWGAAASPSSSQGRDEHQPNEASRVLGDVPPNKALLQGSCWPSGCFACSTVVNERDEALIEECPPFSDGLLAVAFSPVWISWWCGGAETDWFSVSETNALVIVGTSWGCTSRSGLAVPAGTASGPRRPSAREAELWPHLGTFSNAAELCAW